jgi:hypothetical protein
MGAGTLSNLRCAPFFMSDPVDPKDPKDKAAAPGAPPPDTKTDAKSSGRVAFDARGNPTWEWQTSTGVFGREVSTQRLKKLEASELSIVDTPPTAPQKKKGFELSLDEPQMPNRESGFNPYNSAPSGAKAKVADEPRKPPTDLRKLDAWIKMKKGLAEKDKKK